MIRFRCPHCEKSLKVSEGKAGAAVVCPRCQERSEVPTDATMTSDEEQTPVSSAWDQTRVDQGDESPPFFSGMSQGLRWTIAALAGVSIFSLLLAILASWVPALASATSVATILVPLAVVALLVILYGHGTSCPACRKWWAKSRVGTELVDREVFDKEGITVGRSTYRTTYACDSCRHRWSETFTDEYKKVLPERPRRRVS
jgi:phage FluMu protein Com